MRRILETIFDSMESDVIMTEEQLEIDKELRELLQGKTLELYLKLIDLLFSSRIDAEKEHYKKGFQDALILEREIEDIKKAPTI